MRASPHRSITCHSCHSRRVVRLLPGVCAKCACMSILLGHQCLPAGRQHVRRTFQRTSAHPFRNVLREVEQTLVPHTRAHTACAGSAAGTSAPSESEKMLAGRSYYPTDPELLHQRLACRAKLKAFNNSDGMTAEEQRQRLLILESIIGSFSETHPPIVEPPLNCDYGYNLHMGEDVYMNFGCVLLDCNIISIGDRTMFGPNVQLYCPAHPLDPAERISYKGPQSAKPISIGKDCWLGGSVVVFGGVTIGDGCTVGAGSVVTKSIPDYCVAVGNPARIVRELEKPQL